MGVFGQAILVRWRTPGKVDLVGLRDVGGERARGNVDLFSIISRTGAVDIKPGQDFGHGFVDTQDNLDVTGWVLRDNGDGILGPDGSGLIEDRSFDPFLDLLDLLDRLVLGQSIQE